MKKVLLVILLCSLLSGCGVKMSASDAVKDFLDQYNNLSSSVLTDLESVIKNEDLSSEDAEVYRDILKKQYTDLQYEVLNETYNGDDALVETKITVYDLYKVQNEVNDYMMKHQDEFTNEDGVFDNNKYLKYRLDKMKKATDTIDYTINFNVKKDELDTWKVQELSNADLEKIHGIYNYDIEE